MTSERLHCYINGTAFVSGMRFALLQIKVGIISFLRKHRVETCERTIAPIKFSRRSLVTTSEKGFWLKIIQYS